MNVAQQKWHGLTPNSPTVPFCYLARRGLMGASPPWRLAGTAKDLKSEECAWFCKFNQTGRLFPLPPSQAREATGEERRSEQWLEDWRIKWAAIPVIRLASYLFVLPPDTPGPSAAPQPSGRQWIMQSIASYFRFFFWGWSIFNCFPDPIELASLIRVHPYHFIYILSLFCTMCFASVPFFHSKTPLLFRLPSVFEARAGWWIGLHYTWILFINVHMFLSNLAEYLPFLQRHQASSVITTLLQNKDLS